MSSHTTCELVQFRVESARFLHIQPRPRGGPADLEETLLNLVREILETDHHSCSDGCDCVIRDPVEVARRTQVKKISDGTYEAWYQIELVKYRTVGECMPADDPLPEGVR